RAREEREDFERKRQARAARASFISNILDDLKSVYDRVERARILVPAHKSAKTYGLEMRDLIEARVKLLNVERALKRGESRIEGPDKQNKLERYVKCMHEYLKTLTDEFKKEYRPIALSQARFEAQRDQWKEDLKKDQAKDPPENQAWQKLRCLPALKDFMGLSEPNCNSHEDNSESGKEASSYEERFSKPLGYATELLRNELNTIYKK
ncbi:MAG: hypothetical protein R3293_22850, partial [Candidatus Promineifilaceae bacterium]|nr:hypothetical protein [Candidatus Promineifilaceae bacterium]